MNDHSRPTDSLLLSMRTYYSINFIAAAAHEASSAARIEAAYDGFDADKALLHKGAVAASIFMSIAAVEACINEFFRTALMRIPLISRASNVKPSIDWHEHGLQQPSSKKQASWRSTSWPACWSTRRQWTLVLRQRGPRNWDRDPQCIDAL
ncbi:hypothetical protein PQQ81_31350 [Paraburkholderia strydomiana]|uniref:hypothetical protein n=1 Tax=Paraburkholderia strydomiana TaxID=1245417 RepID=UPI0038B8CCC5